MTPSDLAFLRQREHRFLAWAQLHMKWAAEDVDRAARYRAEQGDEHAERDAATYRVLAKLLRGEYDAEICTTIESVVTVYALREEGVAEIGLRLMPILARLSPATILRAVRNPSPSKEPTP